MLSDMVADFAALHQWVQADLARAMRGGADDGLAGPRALGLALMLGALHALTPGHGKVFAIGHGAQHSAAGFSPLRVSTPCRAARPRRAPAAGQS